MKALIDGDILAYRFGCVWQYTIEWDENTKSDFCDTERAAFELDHYVDWVVQRVEADDYAICLSSDLNFRYQVLPTYKHNRADKTPPSLVEWLKSYMPEAHPYIVIEPLEADDVMGILQTRGDEETIICTIDKDLDQIVGKHYNLNKDILYEVDQETADYFFYQQILTGDSVDGFKGIPRCGPVCAQKLLDATPHDEWWSAIMKLAEKKGLDEDYMLQQARVARILRASDYNFNKKEIILWTPMKGGE